MAKENIKQAKLEKTVELHFGNALTLIPSFKEEFDFVTDVFEIGPILDEVFDDYLKGKKERNFNEIFIHITKEDFSVDYGMNEEKIKTIKQLKGMKEINYVTKYVKQLKN